MEASIILCESATVADQKVFILGGGWNKLTIRGPVALAVAGVILTSEEDLGEHDIRIVLCDEAGDPVVLENGEGVEFTGHMVVREPTPDMSWPSSNPYAFGFIGVPIPAGRYEFQVRVDGGVVAAVPFSAVEDSDWPEEAPAPVR